ncbi:MAG TPA: nicotinate (nicotinamide) nucleotide adenylyltransferase [Gemmatimonadetes bacterium]|nr:nicotinate (nicotinamide) nucleotide adenylyltransferase [Gemmatimonadota bacterium]
MTLQRQLGTFYCSVIQTLKRRPKSNPRQAAKRTVNGAETTSDRVLNDVKMSRRRVGIFGGSFDPPHMGHVSVAREVLEALALDELVWVPAFCSPHKLEAKQTAPIIRLDMVREATLDEPRFLVDDCEIVRKGLSYTVDTLREIKGGAGGESSEILLIMGADQYAFFDRWREPQSIRELAKIVVLDREGRTGVEEVGVLRVPVKRVDISSTEVRARIACGDSVRGWVPDGVALIIEREGLYRP